jgi:hypothetical protein
MEKSGYSSKLLAVSELLDPKVTPRHYVVAYLRYGVRPINVPLTNMSETQGQRPVGMCSPFLMLFPTSCFPQIVTDITIDRGQRIT